MSVPRSPARAEPSRAAWGRAAHPTGGPGPGPAVRGSRRLRRSALSPAGRRRWDLARGLPVAGSGRGWGACGGARSRLRAASAGAPGPLPCPSRPGAASAAAGARLSFASSTCRAPASSAPPPATQPRSAGRRGALGTGREHCVLAPAEPRSR